MDTIHTAGFSSPIGRLTVASTQKGLVYVELPHANGRGFRGWLKTHAPGAAVLERRAPNDEAIDQIRAYLDGERRSFELTLDLRATAFQKSVYKRVAQIGYGETVAYSDIADGLDRPRAVRAVGAANGANPIPLVIPCHRVIARGGSLQGYAGGLELKARLLAMERALPEPVAEQARLF
jgi:O-6-methylguanine DNA methyltransferase